MSQRVTNKQLDSKAAYLNDGHGLNLSIEGAYGRTYLCMNKGSKNLFQGTKADVWNVMDVIETVLYFKKGGDK